MGAKPHRQSRHRGAGLRLFLRRGEVPTSGNRLSVPSIDHESGEPEALRIPEQHSARCSHQTARDTGYHIHEDMFVLAFTLVRTIFTAGR